jgi:hypothetical protein
MRFQKVRVHGNTPLNNPFNFCTAHRFNLRRSAAVNTLLTITFWGLYMRGTRLRARETGGLSMYPRGVKIRCPRPEDPTRL